jgi:hypothetical protein
MEALLPGHMTDIWQDLIKEERLISAGGYSDIVSEAIALSILQGHAVVGKLMVFDCEVRNRERI